MSKRKRKRDDVKDVEIKDPNKKAKTGSRRKKQLLSWASLGRQVKSAAITPILPFSRTGSGFFTRGGWKVHSLSRGLLVCPPVWFVSTHDLPVRAAFLFSL